MPAGLPADAAGPARGTLVGALEAAARLPDALGTALAESARDAFTHSVHVHALVLIPLLVALSLLTLTLRLRGWRSTSPTSPAVARCATTPRSRTRSTGSCRRRSPTSPSTPRPGLSP